MNHSFYESRTKEKIKELRNEGQRSQAAYRSGSPSPVLPSTVIRFVLTLLGVLGLLALFVR